jgi:hypothetical protein
MGSPVCSAELRQLGDLLQLLERRPWRLRNGAMDFRCTVLASGAAHRARLLSSAQEREEKEMLGNQKDGQDLVTILTAALIAARRLDLSPARIFGALPDSGEAISLSQLAAILGIDMDDTGERTALIVGVNIHRDVGHIRGGGATLYERRPGARGRGRPRHHDTDRRHDTAPRSRDENPEGSAA